MFRTISMQQLEQLLDGERTFTLLDVREQKEYEAGHLLGAVNLPSCGHLLRLRRSESARGERTRGTRV